MCDLLFRLALAPIEERRQKLSGGHGRFLVGGTYLHYKRWLNLWIQGAIIRSHEVPDKDAARHRLRGTRLAP